MALLSLIYIDSIDSLVFDEDKAIIKTHVAQETQIR